MVSWLSQRRTHHDARLAVVSNSGRSFREVLMRQLIVDSGEKKITQTSEAKTRKVCFVFPGQGQQWAGMGQKLYCTEPVFRTMIEKGDAIFTKMSGTSLIHDIGFFLAPEGNVSSLIDETEVCQPPILFF